MSLIPTPNEFAEKLIAEESPALQAIGKGLKFFYEKKSELASKQAVLKLAEEAFTKWFKEQQELPQEKRGHLEVRVGGDVENSENKNAVYSFTEVGPREKIVLPKTDSDEQEIEAWQEYATALKMFEEKGPS